MYGCVLIPPVSDDGDFGTLFIHNEGHGAMCGHGCIAVSTAVFDTGMMSGREGINELRLDTPAGRVTSFVNIENGRVKNVTFQNVPTFVYEENIKIPVEGIGEVTGDLVFGVVTLISRPPRPGFLPPRHCRAPTPVLPSP